MYPTAVRERALALLDAGVSLNATSKQLGISRSAIRHWRDHGIGFGRQGATCFACGSSQPTNREAYSVLLGYYLGDGCISRLRRTYSMRISCDKTYPGIIQDVTDAIRAVHVRGRVCLVDAPGVVVVQSCWNHWPCVFPQHGPGRKHERTLELADWQRELVAEHPAAFLRGLFHSDGSRTANWATATTVSGERKRYEYPRWQFVNHSADIIAWCTEALDMVGIPWRQSSWKTISVSTRAGVARLDELVGPKR